MLQFDPNDAEEMAFSLSKAVKKSGLTLIQIAERLEQEYGVQLTVSGLSHVITRGTIHPVSAGAADTGGVWGGGD